MRAEYLRNSQHQLAEEISSRDDLMSFAGFGQLEYTVAHTSYAAVVHHMHHGGEAATTVGADALGHQQASATHAASHRT